VEFVVFDLLFFDAGLTEISFCSKIYFKKNIFLSGCVCSIS